MRGLGLARGWYAVVATGALVMTAGHINGATAGSRFDPPIVAIGLTVGILAGAAAFWVESTDGRAAAVTWLGILAGIAPFAYLVWVGATSAQSAIWYAIVPAIVALAAAGLMVRARLAAGRR